jgi:hypothetical protein
VKLERILYFLASHLAPVASTQTSTLRFNSSICLRFTYPYSTLLLLLRQPFLIITFPMILHVIERRARDWAIDRNTPGTLALNGDLGFLCHDHHLSVTYTHIHQSIRDFISL